MKRDKFFLVLMSVFALLFLITFQAYRWTKQSQERYQKIVKAYELYCYGKYDEFSKYVDQYKLKELSYLNVTIKEQRFQQFYMAAVKDFNLGNFASAVEFFKKALQQLDERDPRKDELLYYLSISLVNSNRLQEAKLELSTFVNLENSPYRNKALQLLIDIYRKTGEIVKAQEIEKLLLEVKK
ncbi:tetratricopeptide repeat protein [Thermotoga profunda]|uniref:tetratricopeptide repeat protein n=1 Tax=Thermotoga profunda TaxID=1508420 RepID=UPI000694E47F|nr:tetratricopeptide repeat protein [Thermotoga profunda]